MLTIYANIARIGKYSLKVLNSLCHGGPYIAVHIGEKRVAWISFKTKKHTSYDSVASGDLKGIGEVEQWLNDRNNFNLAASKWNDFKNGVYVTLL